MHVTVQAPFEEFLYNIVGLGHDYGSIGGFNHLQAVLTLDAIGVQLADVSPPPRLAIKYLVCPFAKLLGFKAFYPEYY